MSDTSADEAIDFGDDDPEDAYDEGDDIETKLDVLERAVESIRVSTDARREARRAAVDELIAKLQARAAEIRTKADALRELWETL